MASLIRHRYGKRHSSRVLGFGKLFLGRGCDNRYKPSDGWHCTLTISTTAPGENHSIGLDEFEARRLFAYLGEALTRLDNGQF